MGFERHEKYEDTQDPKDLLVLPDPPPVPEWAEEQWKKILHRIKSPRIEVGLRFWMDGHSWRESAERVGINVSAAPLRDAAKRYGLYQLAGRTDRLIQNQREVALEADAELLKRLRDQPQEFTNNELNVAKGVAVDKILAHEKGRAQDTGEKTPFEVLADAVARGDVEFKLELASRKGEEPRPVEITVESVHGE